MIASFKHRGLKALYEGRTARRVGPEHVRKLLDILGVLDRSRTPQDVNLPGFRLHGLKGWTEGPLRDHRVGELAGDLPVRGRRHGRCGLRRLSLN